MSVDFPEPLEPHIANIGSVLIIGNILDAEVKMLKLPLDAGAIIWQVVILCQK